MSKKCFFVFALVLIFLTASQETLNASTKRKIIIDSDTGADDGSAIILAAKNQEIELLGVTVL